jgi:YEATS domain-containing protein 4
MATKRRLENTTICCPIIVGSFAHLLLPASERKNYALLDKKGPDDLSTHEWTLFVRGPNGEDLSVFINKVVFQLHPSFPFPVREITSPPFEVTETGWGEFECGIRMFFKDPDEDPIDVSHLLKLYHTPTPGSTLAHLSKKPVVYEHYDEIVFTNPSEEFGKLLSQYVSPAEVPPHRLQVVASTILTTHNHSQCLRRTSLVSSAMMRT